MLSSAVVNYPPQDLLYCVFLDAFLLTRKCLIKLLYLDLDEFRLMLI